MTPEQRWQTARRLYWTMRRHKAAFLKSLHPDWSDEKVEAEVRDFFPIPEPDLIDLFAQPLSLVLSPTVYTESTIQRLSAFDFTN